MRKLPLFIALLPSLALASGVTAPGGSVSVSTGSPTSATVVATNANVIVLDTSTLTTTLLGPTSTYTQVNGSSVTLAGSTFNTSGKLIRLDPAIMSSSKFLTTTASLGATTYDLLNGTQTWTGAQTHTGTVNLLSSLLLAGAAGTFQQALLSSGPANAPYWGVVTGTITSNYSQSFINQTSVTLTHNLGSENVIVQCFTSDTSPIQIGWNSLTLTSTNTAVVTFSSGQSGYCVVSAGGGGVGGSGGFIPSPNYAINFSTSEHDLTSWPGYANAGLQVTVHPTSSTALWAIAVITNCSDESSNQHIEFDLAKDGTAPLSGYDDYTFCLDNSGTNVTMPVAFVIPDVPGDTNPHTYTLVARGSSSVAFVIGGNNVRQTMFAWEVH